MCVRTKWQAARTPAAETAAGSGEGSGGGGFKFSFAGFATPCAENLAIEGDEGDDEDGADSDGDEDAENVVTVAAVHTDHIMMEPLESMAANSNALGLRGSTSRTSLEPSGSFPAPPALPPLQAAIKHGSAVDVAHILEELERRPDDGAALRAAVAKRDFGCDAFGWEVVPLTQCVSVSIQSMREPLQKVEALLAFGAGDVRLRSLKPTITARRNLLHSYQRFQISAINACLVWALYYGNTQLCCVLLRHGASGPWVLDECQPMLRGGRRNRLAKLRNLIAEFTPGDSKVCQQICRPMSSLENRGAKMFLRCRRHSPCRPCVASTAGQRQHHYIAQQARSSIIILH